jgi:hypothetical protein
VASTDDDKHNNLVAAGAVLAVLTNSDFGMIRTVEAQSDAEGNVTNEIAISFGFLRSAYRLTVERIPDSDEL